MCKLLTNFASDLDSGLGNSMPSERDLNFKSQPRCLLVVRSWINHLEHSLVFHL